MPSSGERDAIDLVALSRPGSPGEVALCTDSGGRQNEAESESPLTLLSIVEEVDAFPALPRASGRQASPQTPPPPPPRLRTSETSTREPAVRVDYSSLAETLAVQAAAELVSKPRDGTSADGFVRLSVLPGFGDGRDDEAGGRANAWRSPESSRLQVSQESSPGLIGAGDGGSGLTPGLPFVPSLLLLSPPLSPSPPRPTLAAHISKKKRAGAAAATVALRARLRERWFLLDTLRKAERQRETAERELMAAEDGHSKGRGDDSRGCDGCDGDGGKDIGGARRRQGRPVKRLGGVDDYSSCGSCSDSAEGGTTDGDTGCEGRSQSPCFLLEGTTTVPREETAVAATLPTGHDRNSSSGESTRSSCSNRSLRESALFFEEPKTISAAGAAAIRRAEAAATAAAERLTGSPTTAANACESAPAISTQAHMRTSSFIEQKFLSGRVSNQQKTAVTGSDDAERGGGGTNVGGRDGVPARTGERVHEACEAGMAGLLNDLLVRSGGRAADGKDKVRRETFVHLGSPTTI